MHSRYTWIRWSKKKQKNKKKQTNFILNRLGRGSFSSQSSGIRYFSFLLKLNDRRYYYWSLLYSAILRSQADSLRSHVILHERIAFYSAFLNIHRSGVLTALVWLVPHETAAISARSVYTMQPCIMSLHAKPHTYGVCVFSCNLPPHFWQNDRGLLRATAVTREWNGYRNKSQHRKLTLEKKNLPPLLQGFEPATFRSAHPARFLRNWSGNPVLLILLLLGL